MKLQPLLLIAILFSPIAGFTQETQTVHNYTPGVTYAKDGLPPTPPGTKALPITVKNTVMLTASVGFMNGYKQEYTVPAGFEKGNMTGFAPVYLRCEYGLSHKVTLAFATSFSTIYFNSSKVNVGYNGPIRRYYRNEWQLFSGGLIAYYHFNHLVQLPKLDVFVGAGLNLNNISENMRPQGDSIIAKKSHTATPTVKVGARYYVTPAFSVFADAGYDKLSIFSVGISCRFAKWVKGNK